MTKLTQFSGLGKAQYFYWFILAMIAFLDSAQLHVIATIAPVLRCEWEMDVKWETLINVSVYLFSAVGSSLLYVSFGFRTDLDFSVS